MIRKILGPPGTVGNMETWNGTSWTEQNDLNTARYQTSAAGNSTAALVSGGSNPGGTYLTATEEFTANAPVGAWATGADLNTAREYLAGSGTDSEAALAFAGSSGPNLSALAASIKN